MDVHDAYESALATRYAGGAMRGLFSARHRIEPVVEYFPMSRVNEAIAHLEAGKARYRVVLENDLG